MIGATGNLPAFPCTAQGDRSVPPEHDYIQTGPYAALFPGMSLRDWFASQAFNVMPPLPVASDPDAMPNAIKAAARIAYAVADAMLAEREPKPVEVKPPSPGTGWNCEHGIDEFDCEHCRPF